MDIVGQKILFPECPYRVADVFATEREMRSQIDRYRIHYPKQHVDFQVLQVLVSLAVDYATGAEKFIKGTAIKLGLKNPDRSAKGAAVRSNMTVNT